MIVNMEEGLGDFLERMETLLPKNKNYYYYNINNLSKLHTIVDKKDFLAQNNLCLLLDCCMEGFQSMIPAIYSDLIIHSNIKEEDIFLVSGVADIENIVQTYAQQFKRKPFGSIWMSEFEYMIACQARLQITNLGSKFHFITNRFEKKGFQKSFISLNRRWRLHRPVLVAMLASRNLLTRGYVSLTEADMDSGYEKVYDSILSTHSEDEEIFDYFLNNYEYLKSFPQLTLDVESLNIPETYCLSNTLDYFYANSYFSVVTETNYYINKQKYNSLFASICEGTRFLSEKTFKPMVYKHPFILASVPHCLKLLKELGYKTFHPFIDESYDEELDDGKRMIKILNEIEKLCYLNEKQLQQFLEDTHPIVEHNFKHLLERRNIIFRT
jgi:hypothetical protein